MAAVPRFHPSAVPARSTPSVWPVMGTGVKERWIEILCEHANESGRAYHE
jgi:hypothetical protein